VKTIPNLLSKPYDSSLIWTFYLMVRIIERIAKSRKWRDWEINVLRRANNLLNRILAKVDTQTGRRPLDT
jgi:hypothetical protein